MLKWKYNWGSNEFRQDQKKTNNYENIKIEEYVEHKGGNGNGKMATYSSTNLIIVSGCRFLVLKSQTIWNQELETLSLVKTWVKSQTVKE